MRATLTAVLVVAIGCAPSRFEETTGADGGGSGGTTRGEDPSTTTEASTSVGSTASEGSTTDVDAASSTSSSTGEDVDVPPGFLQQPDGWVSHECSTYEQDCPPGEKCMWWANDGGNAWNATRCSPIDPDPDGFGESCTVVGSGVSGVDSCDGGLMCWGVDPETELGTCVEYCVGSESDPICEHVGGTCAINGEGFSICLPSCDPLAQDCGANWMCVEYYDAVFMCVSDQSGDTGVAGDPCEFPYACDPALACVPAENFAECDAWGCCTPFCDLDDPSCPADLECVSYFDPAHAPWEYQDVGVCALP